MSPSAPRFDAFFLPAAQGQRLCVLHAPPSGNTVRGCVIYAHPFAEELNRARRMADLQARALASAGFAVLLLDQFGCGDSSGDFGQASWTTWLDDLTLAAQWLTQRHGGPLWLWGLRTGCLLAAQVAGRQSVDGPVNLLLWQPVLSGRQYVRQFLRLRMAAEVARGGRGESTEALAARLAAGEGVEVAGYLLSPPLAQGLEQATLQGLTPPGRVACLELQADALAPLSPGLETLVQGWRQAGHAVSARVVAGEPFWQSLEVDACPELLAASTQAMLEGEP